MTRTRTFLLGALGIATVIACWEIYIGLAPQDGVLIGETRVLPRPTALAMPHVWEMVTRLFEPETSASSAQTLIVVILEASLVTLAIAIAGWLIGSVLGMALAVFMQRFRIVERGLLPWVILSQTVPLIAFAPMVKSWGSNIDGWPDWLSVAVIASYLSFFPVAVGALKGLQSPQRIHTELMSTYSAGYWDTLTKVRLPAAVPYLLPALRLGAASSVVGTVVAEVSIAYLDGIGRKLIGYAGQASGDPAKAWAPIFGAVLVGLVAAALVAGLGQVLSRYRRTEAR
ncbi:MAG: ABC transporter permease [Nocardioides sp.]